MAQKMYVDANEIMEDWGAQEQKLIRLIADLNTELLKMNPYSIIIQGKCNCKWYLENCYGEQTSSSEGGV